MLYAGSEFLCVQPLTWSFGHIISAYNNFPELDNLYSFRDSIQPFSLGHGRRVLLSAMYLLLQGRAVDMKSWGDAYQALLFSSETDFIDCPGRNAANELFLEQLSDDAGISMRECQSEEIVALVLEHFSEKIVRRL